MWGRMFGKGNQSWAFGGEKREKEEGKKKGSDKEKGREREREEEKKGRKKENKRERMKERKKEKGMGRKRKAGEDFMVNKAPLQLNI